MKLDDRIDRLVGRILDGNCLPFLGAGISGQAPLEPETSASETGELPTLSAAKIAERLGNSLKQHANAIPLERRSPGLHELMLCTAGSPTQGQQTTPVLGEVAELCWAELGPTRTVRVLQFDKWHCFRPTAAHHYLAVLVREGFISEILETNYDDFVERALAETFGEPVTRKRRGANVLHDLMSYRRHIAQPRKNEVHENLLRVVKLNGCASAWCEAAEREPGEPEGSSSHLERASRAIVLTEEQLQGWNDKGWARDLLQVRTRGESLFFVGFAGVDPLVRHHVLAVVREFSADPEREARRQKSPWSDEPNAPFLMEYKGNLNFSQFQMLRAFREAHRREDDQTDVYTNTFLGTDGPDVRARLGQEADPRKELKADDLLALVAARAVERALCERYLSDRSALHAYLRGALRRPQTLLACLRNEVRKPQSVSGGAPTRWTTYMALDRPTRVEQGASPWARACMALRCERAGRGGYRPFLDSPVKQPMLLVLLLLLGRVRGEERELPTAQALAAAVDGAASSGVCVIPRSAERGHRMVLAASSVDAVIEHWKREPDAAHFPDELVVLALGRGTIVFRRQVRAVLKPWMESDPGEIAVRRLHIVGDLAAMRGPSGEGSLTLPEVERNLALLARVPAEWPANSDGWQQYCTEAHDVGGEDAHGRPGGGPPRGPAPGGELEPV